MKKLLAVIFGVLAGFGLLGFLAAPVSAVELGEDPICESGAGVYTAEELKALGCKAVDDKSGDIGVVMSNIIKIVIAVIGIVAVIVIIISGVTFLTSQGDPAKVKRAKDTILYAVLGLILSVLAYTIVNFVSGAINPGDAGTDTETKTKTETETGTKTETTTEKTEDAK